MRKETENGNFDRSCFVQTVYLCTVLLTKVASDGWNKTAYTVGLKLRVWWVDVYTVTQDRDTTDWRRARNLVKLAELFTVCVPVGNCL